MSYPPALPTPQSNIQASTQGVSTQATVPICPTGSIYGFRFRGFRDSVPFIKAIESILASVSVLRRRTCQTQFFTDPNPVQVTLVTGPLGVSIDPRVDPNVASAVTLLPQMSKYYTCVLSSLLTQVQFNLTNT